jgi:hypothetical protein
LVRFASWRIIYSGLCFLFMAHFIRNDDDLPNAHEFCTRCLPGVKNWNYQSESKKHTNMTMKNIVTALAVLMLLISYPAVSFAQSNLKIRLTGNVAKFMGEPQGTEIQQSEIEEFNNTQGPFDDFTNQGRLGIGAEVMMALTEKAWVGLELSSTRFKGHNDNPPWYNLLKTTDFHQLRVKPLESGNWIPLLPVKDSLQYATSLINLLANFRFYLSEGQFRPFIKIHSGVSFIATELSYNLKGDWPPSRYVWTINGVPLDTDNYEFNGPVIYSRGTSTSPENRWPALNLGGGIGFEYQINEKLSFYADATYSMINSDILDGRPNFDYNEDTFKFERFNTFGNVGQISFGLCYSLGEGMAIAGGGSKGGKGGSKSGRQHPYLPFYNIKRR